jgi:hypothetical protein
VLPFSLKGKFKSLHNCKRKWKIPTRENGKAVCKEEEMEPYKKYKAYKN